MGEERRREEGVEIFKKNLGIEVEVILERTF